MRDPETGALRLIDLEFALWPADQSGNVQAAGTTIWWPPRPRYPYVYDARSVEIFTTGALLFHFLLFALGMVDDFDQPAERGGYDEDSPDGLRSKAAVAHHAWWLTKVCAWLAEMMSDDSAQRPSMVESARRIRDYRDLFVAGTIARAEAAADFGHPSVVTAQAIVGTYAYSVRKLVFSLSI